MKKYILLSVALCCTNLTVFAQDLTYQSKKIYQLDKKKESYIFGTEFGLVVTGLLLNATNNKGSISAEKIANLDKNYINGFDRGVVSNYSQSAADVSDILLATTTVLPIVVFYLDKDTRKEYKTLSVMGAEIFLGNNALSFNAKYAFNRFRPEAYNTDLPLSERNNTDNRYSFYSAHVSQTAAFSFFFAKVMTDFHPGMSTWSKVGIWSVAATLPAAQAALRVYSGKHFYSDVMVGYAVGASFGLLIPYLHKEDGKGNAFSITPIYQPNAKGLAIDWRF